MTPDRRQRRWCFMDLVTDPVSGRLRETAVWSSAGKASLLWGFFWQLHHGGVSEWYAGIFVGAVIFHELGSRLLSNRQQNAQEAPHV